MAAWLGEASASGHSSHGDRNHQVSKPEPCGHARVSTGKTSLMKHAAMHALHNQPLAGHLAGTGAHKRVALCRAKRIKAGHRLTKVYGVRPRV